MQQKKGDRARKRERDRQRERERVRERYRETEIQGWLGIEKNDKQRARKKGRQERMREGISLANPQWSQFSPIPAQLSGNMY